MAKIQELDLNEDFPMNNGKNKDNQNQPSVTALKLDIPSGVVPNMDADSEGQMDVVSKVGIITAENNPSNFKGMICLWS